MNDTKPAAPQLKSGILMNDYFNGFLHFRAGQAAVVDNPYHGQLRGPRNRAERDLILEAEARFDNPEAEADGDPAVAPTRYSTPHQVPKRAAVQAKAKGKAKAKPVAEADAQGEPQT